MTATNALSTDHRRSLRLDVQARCETPINMGGYGAPTFVDRPFRRDRNGWPFVPATSLKGRLRHECERLARALGEEICSGPAPDQLHRGAGCVICTMFGSPWLAGRLYPANLTLAGPPELQQAQMRDEPAPAADVRYNVSLSRRRRMAEDARLFTTEVFLPGVSLIFAGSWEAELTLKELALVEAGFGAITALGRGKTAGLGWTHITVKTQVWEDGALRPITKDERQAGRTAWQA